MSRIFSSTIAPKGNRPPENSISLRLWVLAGELLALLAACIAYGGTFWLWLAAALVYLPFGHLSSWLTRAETAPQIRARLKAQRTRPVPPGRAWLIVPRILNRLYWLLLLFVIADIFTTPTSGVADVISIVCIKGILAFLLISYGGLRSRVNLSVALFWAALVIVFSVGHVPPLLFWAFVGPFAFIYIAVYVAGYLSDNAGVRPVEERGRGVVQALLRGLNSSAFGRSFIQVYTLPSPDVLPDVARPASPAARRYLPVATLLFSVGLVAVAALLFVPHIGSLPLLSGNGPQWAKGDGTDKGYFGFQPKMDMRGGTPTSSTDVVLQVQSAGRSYWRGRVYDYYDGTSWTSSSDKISRSDAHAYDHGAFLRLIPPGDDPALLASSGASSDAPCTVRCLTQTFRYDAAQPDILFTAYTPYDVYFTPKYIYGDTYGTLRAAAPLDAGTTYTVVSQVPDFSPAVLSAAPALGSARARREADWLQGYYTQLPDSLPPRVRDLAAQVVAGHSANEYTKTQTIVDYLRNTYQYNLKVGPPQGDDAVDDFLFRSKQGYCETFAAAATILLRTQGIPARVVTGYAPGQYDPFSQTYTVRANDAHAWTEVYFPTVGWVPFEPTSSFDVTPASKPPNATPAADLFPKLDGAAALLPFALLLSLVALLAALLWFTRKMWQSPPRPDVTQFMYDLLVHAPESHEAAVIRLYLRSVARFTRHGLPDRAAPQTPAEYAIKIAPQLAPDDGAAFRYLTALTEHALYAPYPMDATQRAEAENAAATLETAQIVVKKGRWLQS